MNNSIKYDKGSGEPDADGSKCWYLHGLLHRTDGPACEYADGSKCWYLHGKRHRTDGPAIEFTSGYKAWYLNDERHRTDGPAIEYADGSKCWYLNDERHRTDGPAIEWENGYKAWFVNGKEAIRIFDQEIRVGNSIEVGGDIGIVLKNIQDRIYLALVGNQKVLILHLT